jgi:N-acetylneuraminate synthase
MSRSAARTPVTRGRVTVIAEAGMNHDGSLGNALRLADVASDCGADAVKFQLHIADAETLRDAPPPPYFAAESRYEYFTRTEFTAAQWKRVMDHCASRRIEFLCSPFSIEAVEVLERLGIARYKVPSGEVTNLPLLERLAATRKPVLLSSGMSAWEELDAAVAVFRHAKTALTVLQCTSEYPCAYEHVGLNVMRELSRRYAVPVGLSDHTLTPYASFAAVAQGAAVIEKHVTLSRLAYGSDAKHSLEPDQLRDLVDGIRAIERMLASPVDKNDLAHLRDMRLIFQKSLVARRAIRRGERIGAAMLTAKKPGSGLPASRQRDVVGRRAARAISAGAMLRRDDIDWTAPPRRGGGR